VASAELSPVIQTFCPQSISTTLCMRYSLRRKDEDIQCIDRIDPASNRHLKHSVEYISVDVQTQYSQH